MNKAKTIFLLVGLLFLIVSLRAVFLGTALAWWETNNFNLGLFLLALGGACFLKYIKSINVGVI